MFHRIYESIVLGMHPASLYPRRSRVAPKEENGQRVSVDRIVILARAKQESTICPIGVLGW